MKKRIEVELYEEDIKFIKWLAHQDSVSFHMELESIFYTELRTLKDIFEREYEKPIGDITK